MSACIVFVRFFLNYTDQFPYARVLRLRDDEITGAVEALRDEWWAIPANRVRIGQERLERSRHDLWLQAIGDNFGLTTPIQCTDVIESSQADGAIELRASFEEIGAVAGWIRWPSMNRRPSHWKKLPSPGALLLSASQDRVAAAAAPWQNLPPLDAFPPYRISPRYPMAMFDSQDTATDATAALQARVRELVNGADSQQDRDELAVLLREANPQFFVWSESALTRPELALAKEQVQRLRGPIVGTPSDEERFVRVYWPLVSTTLAQFDLPANSKSFAAPTSTQSPELEKRPATKPKRSTKRGDASAKIISALTKHHQYADGGCLVTEPIGVNELARQADVAPSSVTEFFKEKFKEHDQYRALCHRSSAELAVALKILNGELAPHLLYGKSPPADGQHDE